MIYVVAAIIVLIASFVIALITLANESKKEKEMVSKGPVTPLNRTDTHFSDLAPKANDEAVSRLQQAIARESEKESSEISGHDEILEGKHKDETAQIPKEKFPWEIDSESSDSESNQVNEASSKNVFDPREHVISIADLARQQREDV